MGNLLGGSSSDTSSTPGAPPQLIVACISGGYDNYIKIYDELVKDQTDSSNPDSSNPLTKLDSQGNSVLHALFSSQSPSAEILEHIHSTLAPATLSKMYAQKSVVLGCNPIWICVAYGNLEMLKLVISKLDELDDSNQTIQSLINVPNLQGDTALLATCSRGNLPMLQHLSTLLPPSTFTSLLTTPNKNGTTPLLTILSNSHPDLLTYLVSLPSVPLPLSTPTSSGLYPLHIASERGNLPILTSVLESVGLPGWSCLDKNGATPLHVSSFIGNLEVCRVLVEYVGSNVRLLKLNDSQNRTPYLIAMLKGHDEVGDLLSAAGAGEINESERKEIMEAKERREEGKRKREEERRKIKGAEVEEIQ
ncbi:hypothetical protein TrVE_jg4723 [Triparma verrucosa]|uniref:Ankyrin n=1 Tax=Triparma verrucosa TaxID=1606542 RepID=A0A9W7CC03_9STRA|nr:hypothetical protein TrVE_jg4723 [Triparma verrucosa]